MACFLPVWHIQINNYIQANNVNISSRLRVLIVDDTIFYRKIIGDILSELPYMEIVGTANNGKIAMSRIRRLKPDLITLDIEMPEMNGLQVLEQIRLQAPDVEAIVLSSLTHEGGEMTIKALELGAFDFIPKPDAGTLAANKLSIKELLVPMLNAFTKRREIKNILKGRPRLKPVEPAKELQSPYKRRIDSENSGNLAQRMRRISTSRIHRSEIVAIGISTGGPNALSKIMPEFPPDINVPILIVQHMPPIFTKSLANSLNSKSPIEVKEAKDGENLMANIVYIAPGGKQMKIVAPKGMKKRVIRITDDPPENSCRPSVDYLFKSIAYHFLSRATGVIMTGMGSDGTLGVKLMKRNGAYIIAQDESTCTVFGMPKEPIELGIVDVIAPLETIVKEIINSVNRA